MYEHITELFCIVDDFCKAATSELAQHQINQGPTRKPTRIPGLTDSEIITILLLYQNSDVRNFKAFYTHHVLLHKKDFPNLPTYERFVTLQQRGFFLLLLFFMCLRQTGASHGYVDSTPLKVCHNKRIFNHKVFKGLAARGKSTMGWFFGFKLHIVIDTEGNIIDAVLTPGNCDDRKPVESLLKNFQGKIFGDKGYISQDLFNFLFSKGVKLITGIKARMKNILMDFEEKILLRKRSLVETVFGFLKRTREIEHTRHRSVTNMCIHVVATLVGYQLMPNKPQIKRTGVLAELG
jgi:transposase